MAYIGQSNKEVFAKARREDEYVGNGAQTDFILSQSVPGAFATNIIVIVNGQIKDPYDDYTITGSNWLTLHFIVAPPDTHKIVVVHLGELSQYVTPSTGSVTADSLDPNLRNFASDIFTGNGAQMNFTLSQEAATSQSLLVMVEGVIQDPGTNYSATGTTLSFISPPDNGAGIRVLHLGFKTAVTFPIDGSIGAAQLDPALRLFNVTDLVGNGSTSVFTMSQSETSANAILVTVEGISQVPGVNYTVSGNQITFIGAPALGAKIHIRHMGMAVPGWATALPVASGGTGATDAAGARTNLGAAPSTHVSDTNNPHSVTANQVLPTQTGNTNFFLKTDGNNVSWAEAAGWLKATAIKTAPYTANKNELVRVDSSGGVVTITVPAAPTDGDLVGVIDITGSAATNNITVACAGGKTIEGDATALTVDINSATVILSYNGSANNWKIVDTPSYGAFPDQTGNTGKALVTNGTNPTWQSVLKPSDIGSTVQAYDADLTSWAGLDPSAKQDTLISGTTIKTINSASVLSSGNIVAGDAFLGTQQSWTKPQRPSLQTETAPTTNTLTWDLTDDQVFQCNLNANITTFNLTGTLSSLLGYQYQFVVRYNGGTTISWNANMKFEGGTAPTLTGTSGKLDIFNFVVASNDGGTTCYLYCTGMSQNL